MNEKSCPCHWTTPCSPDCSCVTRGSSRGCDRCCSFGSDEQRRERAKVIAAKIDDEPIHPSDDAKAAAWGR